MNRKEGLNLLDFLATGINKNDPVIKAVLSDENGEGAIANELEAIAQFINYYTRTRDVKEHRGKSLEMIVKLFSKMQRRIYEPDGILLRRFFALTYRQGDTIWGNALNMKHVLETHFSGINCFVAENTNKDNLLDDGDFEENTTWMLGGGAVWDYQARFSGASGLVFNKGAEESCTKIIEGPFLAGNYAFHFMLWGKCGVIIQNDDGKYWLANDQFFNGAGVLKWVDYEVVNIFDKSFGWDNAYCFLVLPEDSNSLTVKFVGIEGESAFVDYVRFFSKPLNSSYTLILQYSGYAITAKTLHIGIVEKASMQNLNYERESYFDSSFVIGPSAVSQVQSVLSILENVRPRGIQPFIEFVGKKELE
jgi:hypothetical protein